MEHTSGADAWRHFHEIVRSLENKHLSYRLDVVRDGAILIAVATPGFRWEIEVMESGDVEVERFASDGEILDEAGLNAIWQQAE